MSVPAWAWIATLTAILAVLAVDLLAHRHAHKVTAREALTWSAVWLVLGTGFGAVVWAAWGGQRAGEYFGGYLIEKSLAVDNIFVFALIFTSFAVPQAYQHRVLFYGVLGALVMRAGFIVGGVALLGRFHWVLYIFGAFLLVTAGRMVHARDREPDPRGSRSMRLVRSVLPAVEDYHGPRFWVRRAGRLAATPLLVVLVLIEISDLIFAADSIPAILAITGEPFLVFTSNAFAILGLRSLYFLLADLMHRFAYLKLGLAAVLAFVGLKMLLADLITIPIAASLGIIAGCLAIAIIASLRATRAAPAGADEAPVLAGSGRRSASNCQPEGTTW
jgi:tellurite resistance protein TerC